jgi:hypothetical protein
MDDEYWQHAQDCTRWAAEAKSEINREAFLYIAKVWTQLALHKHIPPPDTASDAFA